MTSIRHTFIPDAACGAVYMKQANAANRPHLCHKNYPSQAKNKFKSNITKLNIYCLSNLV